MEPFTLRDINKPGSRDIAEKIISTGGKDVFRVLFNCPGLYCDGLLRRGVPGYDPETGLKQALGFALEDMNGNRLAWHFSFEGMFGGTIQMVARMWLAGRTVSDIQHMAGNIGLPMNHVFNK